MFSGIVEEAGRVKAVTRRADGNVDLRIACSFAADLRIDQSLAHNGVCLTVVDLHGGDGTYTVTAVPETLNRSNLGLLREGDRVNLERCMRLDGRLDGHIVQGHVDCRARCTALDDLGGSRMLTFEYTVAEEMRRKGYLTVEKGSVTVNGVSLTVCDSQPGRFSVALIPYTLEHTNLGDVVPGTEVNLEFDIIGKYISAMIPQP